MARGKPVSRTVKVVGISVGALIVVVLLVIAFFPWNWLRGPASRALSSDLHRRVSIAALHGSLFGHPRVQVTGLTISNPPWAGGGQMVSIQRIELELRFWPLLRGEIVLPRVALIRPDVHVVRLADGRATGNSPLIPRARKPRRKPISQ